MLVVGVFTGCRAEAIGKIDPAEIEATVREYYQAFNNYDLSRIEAVFTDEAWQEEGSGLSAWLRTAESLGFKSEFVSIASVRNDGSTVLATVEKITSLRGAPLLVDTGDEDVDRSLTGYTRVICGYEERIVLRVAS